MLQTQGPGAADTRAFDDWHSRVERMRRMLQWPDAPIVIRPHPGGATLALAAPLDQLFAATEVNEWAWLASLGDSSFHSPGHAASWDEDTARHTLSALSLAERNPSLMSLVETAHAGDLPFLLDDEFLTLGLGRYSRSWPLTTLPTTEDVPWDSLRAIPTALVTGSNGKTTTVRLVAAMAQSQGWRSAHSCTDGLYFEQQRLASGDYSGPAGARTVLRHSEVEAAILETARGGILRRGVALSRVDAAAITNLSIEHFGEYGIHDLDGLADVKLALARALKPQGVLVLNADDALLRSKAAQLHCSQAWFALDYAHPHLQLQRQRGDSSCGVMHGRLRLSVGNVEHDLGPIDAMPLTAGGQARYNIANIAAAALLAHAMGVHTKAITGVLARFGSARSDNPGRLQRWHFGGLSIYTDYAHNPDGLRGLLQLAIADRRNGRLGLALGQAGNREESDIRALAQVAASFDPKYVVLKDVDGFLRGRQPGEVPALLRDELLRQGVSGGILVTRLREIDAVREALSWARDGDTLVLPVHSLLARAEADTLLDGLQNSGWCAGEPLPA